MKKDEIVKAVRDYINNDKANYAVLINGAWGVGKTYFYEHNLKTEMLKTENGKNNRKANVYISLYGISSVEQLSKEILINYFVEVKLRGDKNKKKLYGQMSRATGIFSKTFSFSINGLSIDIDKGIEEIKNSIQFKDMIICFDDFERCSIPVNELFGIINNLVEHCNCKVIILADEDNIGKMYANTNIETKYLTLLTGKNLKLKEKRKTKEKDEDTNEITVEELKRFNEEIYSENYIYKDIKEKVIGLSLKYTPTLKDEFDTIISDTVGSSKLSDKLLQKKTKILECMNKCSNSNIRTMKTWLFKFERIYKVIEKYFTDELYEKYFDVIFDRFMIYSIRVSCALGKNSPLKSWENGIEVGNVRLNDTIYLESQGYRFIDDLFIESVLDEGRVCHAAKNIVKELQDAEELEKGSLKGQSYYKLKQWYYYEDAEIVRILSDLKIQIENNEFEPQDYQNIISILVILEHYEFVKEDFIADISALLKSKLIDIKERFLVENFGMEFIDDKSDALFKKYYDPLHSFMEQKDIELDKQDLSQMIDCSSGNAFSDSCYKNSDEFWKNGHFINYVDLDRLINIIQTGALREIYSIGSGFEKVYEDSNLYEVYPDDLDILKDLLKRIEELVFKGRSRKMAAGVLCDTLKEKISLIENKRESDSNK